VLVFEVDCHLPVGHVDKKRPRTEAGPGHGETLEVLEDRARELGLGLVLAAGQRAVELKLQHRGRVAGHHGVELGLRLTGKGALKLHLFGLYPNFQERGEIGVADCVLGGIHLSGKPPL